MTFQEKFFNYLKRRMGEEDYLLVAGWDDIQNRGMREHYFKKEELNYKEIKQIIEIDNEIDGYGIGIGVNFYTTNKRDSKNVERIFHIPIDIDGTKEFKIVEEVKNVLEKIGLKYIYLDESQNGYHFLIPLNLPLLEIEKEKLKNYRVEQFLKFLHNTIDTSIDLKVQDLVRIFRIPETMNNKQKNGKEKTRLKTLECYEIYEEDIEKNNENFNFFIEQQKEKEYKFKRKLEGNNEHFFKEIEEQQKEEEIVERDIFFEGFLRDEELKNHIAEKSGIQKNDILFKNLAIYLKHFPDLEEIVFDFVELCDHSIKEFEGWLKKEMGVVNYREIRNWIYFHNLDSLKQLINDELKDKTDFFDYYQICYIFGVKSDFRYLVFDETSKTYSLHKEKQLFDFLNLEALKLGYNLVDVFGISRINPENEKPYSIEQLNRMKISKIREKFEEPNFLISVYDFGYKPTDERYFSHMGNKFFNIYREGKFENYFEPKEEYKFPYIEKLLRHITGDDEGSYDYFNRWLSYILKNPTNKLPSSLIFKGTQGIGKGRLREWILNYIFGEQNVEEINDSNLENIWGDYVKNNRFVVVNEIQLSGKQGSKIYKRIKEYSTDKEISIQQKNKPLEKIKNYSHWVFFSDQDMPIKIEKNDRRHTVFHQDNKIPTEITDNLSPELNEGYLEEELKDYVSYLKTLKVEFNDVAKFHNTKAKEEVIEVSKDSVEDFLSSLSNSESLFDFIKLNNESLMFEHSKDPKKFIEYISSKEFYKLYKDYCISNEIQFPKGHQSFGMFLQKLNIKTHRQRNLVKDGSRFYYVDDIMKNIENYTEDDY